MSGAERPRRREIDGDRYGKSVTQSCDPSFPCVLLCLFAHPTGTCSPLLLRVHLQVSFGGIAGAATDYLCSHKNSIRSRKHTFSYQRHYNVASIGLSKPR